MATRPRKETTAVGRMDKMRGGKKRERKRKGEEKKRKKGRKGKKEMGNLDILPSQSNR